MARACIGRRIRFSLRILLVLATLVCMVLGCAVRPVVRQKKAVAFVNANYGIVEYDYESDSDYAGKLPGPDWLCQLVGVDYFASVATVVIPKPVGDIAPLEGLTQLKFLVLHECEQGQLKTVGSLRNLRGLALVRGEFSDLSPLGNLAYLRQLHLIDVNVAKQQVTQLQMKLPNCVAYCRHSSGGMPGQLPLSEIDEAEARAMLNDLLK